MKTRLFLSVLGVLLLGACSNTATAGLEPTATSTSPVVLTATVPQPPTQVQLPTATLPTPENPPVATATQAATVVPTASAIVVPVDVPASSSTYIDDRSTPSQVIVSFYNAIDRKEYLRAYSYWDNPANSLGSYSSWASGYSTTASVDLVFGSITGDEGMSQYHYTVPVILKATSTTGVRTNYAACYIVHASVPDVYGAPPFAPMGIDEGSAVQSDLTASDVSVLASTCSKYPTGSYPVPVAGASLNVDKSNFLDNRSGPIETLSSYVNALNLKQYVRAYYYFQQAVHRGHIRQPPD